MISPARDPSSCVGFIYKGKSRYMDKGMRKFYKLAHELLDKAIDIGLDSVDIYWYMGDFSGNLSSSTELALLKEEKDGQEIHTQLEA